MEYLASRLHVKYFRATIIRTIPLKIHFTQKNTVFFSRNKLAISSAPVNADYFLNNAGFYKFLLVVIYLKPSL